MRPIDHSCYAGASAFLSTPSDLVRFGMAINSGQLLQPATVQLLQTSQRLTSARRRLRSGWDLETVALRGADARGGPRRGGAGRHGGVSDHVSPSTASSVAMTSTSRMRIRHSRGDDCAAVRGAERTPAPVMSRRSAPTPRRTELLRSRADGVGPLHHPQRSPLPLADAPAQTRRVRTESSRARSRRQPAILALPARQRMTCRSRPLAPSPRTATSHRAGVPTQPG